MSHLSRLETQYSDIEVRLHTGGGSVFDGNLIYNACNKSNNIDKIVIDGIAASMGGIIMLSRQKVEIVENGYVMIHAPSSGSYGNAKDMESQAKLLRMVEKNFVAKLMARTGKPKNEVEKWMDGSDYWFDAEACLALGLVTKIIPSRVDTVLPITDPENMENQEVYNMYASLLTADFNPQKRTILNSLSNMKQPLITALNLVGVNVQSSDTAIIEAVTAKLKAVEAERDAAQNKLTENVDAQLKVILDQHQEAGTFAKDKREVYNKIGKQSGVEALLTVLGTTPKAAQAPNLNGLIQNKTSEARADWTFDKWQKEDKKGLEAMAESDPAKFTALFNSKYGK
ncbi:Clp protease ClpP [Tenacibaculum maritimum]|nr:Clp protease ClpP [Tenacibaculum maritimum]MCD9582288.1 Clp protease ClpP [Tenacibaculum maritimum]MCD9636670.1 Clp protease ClpP [Tenacibaculum maritimum]